MKCAANYLLIDVSNSFTKIAYSTKTKLSRASRVPTKSLNAATVRSYLAKRQVTKIIASSVVPAKNRLIAAAAKGTSVIFVDATVNLGVGVKYPQPKSIGADRLANAAAAAALYGCPAIVVDFGTAVTFDIISKECGYIGGVIAAGLEAMTNYLYDRTALLPRLTLREPRSAIGKSTRAAMMAGAVIGYRGLIREILAQIRREAFTRGRVNVIATGGYARLIAAKLPEIQCVHPSLTLEGLRIVGNLNS